MVRFLPGLWKRDPEGSVGSLKAKKSILSWKKQKKKALGVVAAGKAQGQHQDETQTASGFSS